MKPTEIKDLLTGILLIVLASIALGRFPELEQFARREVSKALREKPTPSFFR